MRKTIFKIFLSLLILVFFIANVSFTVVVHYCGMINEISKSQCGMCEEDTVSDFWNLSINDISEETCCKNFVKTTNQIDDVILKKSESNEIKFIQFVLILTSNIQELTNSFSTKPISYHSPPEKIPIHLKNSILLI